MVSRGVFFFFLISQSFLNCLFGFGVCNQKATYCVTTGCFTTRIPVGENPGLIWRFALENAGPVSGADVTVRFDLTISASIVNS